MRRRLIEALPIEGYGVWIVPHPDVVSVAACLLVLALILRQAQRRGLDPLVMYWAGIWGLVGALWGGHVMHIAMQTPHILLAEPWLLVRFADGGKSFFCALLGAGCAGWLYLRWKGAAFVPYADAAVPVMALGYGVLRLGCFLNGDDFGTLSNAPWAVRFPPGTAAFDDHVARGWIPAQAHLSLPVHPTQLYHVATGFSLFIWLRQWRGSRPGSHLMMGIMGYAVIRLGLQMVRGDAVPVLGLLDQAQVFSLTLVLSAIVWCCWNRRHMHPAWAAHHL